MFAFFKRPIVITVLGLALMALLVWFVGPYFSFGFGDAVVQPLASDRARWLTIGAIVGTWIVSLALKRMKAARASRQLMAAVVRPTVTPSAVVSSEAAQLRERFEEAVAALRGRTKGDHSLYDLPWYVIIGAPGSGKTTALVNSGLKFPLEQRSGKHALRGVGGTRNCTWWFTDEAVFLDTAGRYTTQDSDADSDAAGWSEFLSLLRKYRGRRPLNGVLVAISASDLLSQRAATREEHVTAVRRRLEELERELKIQLPVYVLVTKCDLVSGFNEYFDDLTVEARAQVWGVTFPFDRTLQDGAETLLPAELDALIERLNTRVFERIQAEPDFSRRTRIFAFPQQMAALREPLTEFMADVFASTRFDRRMLLRGVYFTSGTQEGTPIDRLIGALSRRAALADEAIAPGRGKAYFIQQLLRDVVFGESGLAGVNRRGEMRLAAWQLGAYAAMLAVVAIGLLTLAVSYRRNQVYLAAVASEVERLQHHPAQGREASLETVLPRLDAVRAVWEQATAHWSSGTLAMRAGLYQGGAVGDAARDAYMRELDGVLLPRIASRIEARLRVDVPEPELLYEYLKAYLMLGQPQHFDKAQVAYIAREEWLRATDADTAAALFKHFESLLESNVQPRPIELDPTLVAQARSTIRQATIPRLVYRHLKLRFLDDAEGRLRLDIASGVGAERVLRRRSGRPLAEPVPDLYTAAVFRSLTGKNTEQIVREFAEDRWVWGDEGQPNVKSSTLVAAVTDIYEDDYIQYWDGVLKDIDVVPLGTLQRTKDALEILARPTSPLRGFLKAVDEQTFLVKPSEPTAPTVTDRIGDVFNKGKQKLGLPTVVPGVNVTRHFADLHRLVTGDSGNAPIDAVVRRLDELQKKVGALGDGVGKTNPTNAGAVGAASEAADSLKLDAEQLPAAVGMVVSRIATGASAALRGGVSGSLANLYEAEVLQQCRGLMSKYPFNPSSADDVPLQDFGRVFGPGGVFDTFFKERLSDLVDTSQQPWVWRRVDSGSSVGGGLPLSRFEDAKRIREIYFRAGSPEPGVAFTVTPFELDARSRSVVLDVHGKTIEYRHDRERTTAIAWPGERPGGPATVTFNELEGSGTQSISQAGAWAWWRLLDAARIEPDAGSDVRYVLRVEKSGRAAQFRIDAGSIRNPFSSSVLRGFRCS
jgi:type VI secretion system protein ImpL